MARQYECVVAVRLPSDVERELRRLARDDDRTLSHFLRRRLTAMTAGSTSGADSNR
jgi:predicted transcriptional regulator